MKRQPTIFIVGLIVIIVLIGGLVYLFKPNFLPFNQNTSSLKESASKKTSDYVAVFLANNQVYFGKISDVNSSYPILKDVYYLRVQRPLTEDADVKVEDKNVAGEQAKNELTLIKLGKEIHGPVDEIKLNKDYILYIEALKEESKVVKAIQQFKTENK